MVDQSKEAVEFAVFHALTILGITPSIVTLASYKVQFGFKINNNRW